MLVLNHKTTITKQDRAALNTINLSLPHTKNNFLQKISVQTDTSRRKNYLCIVSLPSLCTLQTAVMWKRKIRLPVVAKTVNCAYVPLVERSVTACSRYDCFVLMELNLRDDDDHLFPRLNS